MIFKFYQTFIPFLFLVTTALHAAPAPVEKSFHDIRQYGAVGDGNTDNTDSFAKAVEACAAAGGGTIVVPAGTYLTGTITLKSNMTLHLSAGAKVLGSRDWDAYPIIDSRFEGIDEQSHASLIQAIDAENIAITGEGIIDGQGEAWWKTFKPLRNKWREYVAKGITQPPPGEEAAFNEAKKGSYPRPRLVEFLRCRNVRMTGVTLVNSPSWTLHPVYCDNVTFDGLSIIAPDDSPNTDGINPDSSRNVRIANCYIDAGDDCIAIKSGKDEAGRKMGKPSENITITNCTMIHGHGGVTIGSEMSGDVRNVAVSNCVFNQTGRGIRIKTMRGRGGVVEAISANNLIMRNVDDCFSIDMFYQPTKLEPVSERTPKFRNFHFSNITATGCEAAGYFAGLDEMWVEDVSLDTIHIEAEGGLLFKNARNVMLRNASIRVKKGSALKFDHVEGLEIAGARPESQETASPIVYMNTVKRAFIRACTALPGTNTFLLIDGKETSAIHMLDNFLTDAATDVKLGEGVEKGVVIPENGH